MMLDAEKIFAKLVEAGENWADADSAANLYEETKKVVLAEMTLKHSADTKSRVEAESKALVSDEYREHIRVMTEARRVSNRARINYDSLKTLAELRRSQESSRRAEIQLT